MPDAPSATLCSAVPILPARDTATLAAWYQDKLGFRVVFTQRDYGIVERDGVEVHFWGPSGIEPERSMTMFRMGVDGIDALYVHCRARGIVHPAGPLREQPWGLREFAVRDGDGNLLTFFERPEVAG